MNCLSTLILSCLLDPSNLYFTGQIQTELNHSNYGRRWCDDRWCNFDSAELRIGMRAMLTESIEIDYGFLHRSFINTNRDRGEESAFMALTWRPFKR